MSNVIKLDFGARPETADEPAGGSAEVTKLPYSVTRRAHARKPRWSKNGAPEERAKRKARYRMTPEELAAHDRDRNASMHTFVFRSIAAIEDAGEAELVSDVGLDPEKAATKLNKLRQAREATIEHATARIKRLAAASEKLAAAIEAATT